MVSYYSICRRRKLWSRRRWRKGGSRGMPVGKILKSVPLRMHFKHSEAKVRVFEQNTDIMKFKLFHSGTAHEYIFFFF